MLDQPYYYRYDNPRGWRASLVADRSREHWPFLILSKDFSQHFANFRAGVERALQASGASVGSTLRDSLEDACVWLVRRALCNTSREAPPQSDIDFFHRAMATGTKEHRLLEGCFGLIESEAPAA